ncbi:hypothetical protein [Bifidobacterium callitrichidarum]|uniref:Competence protein CoiA n=1 Tax=Bifidobacterium callitrichidarum TaxID=2052941 RepID=A0A2U2NCF3_9BIFI|nr:hypothetical protein [Bifidobacterium callitrichidarum]PWG66768.1 hypothetical protein DF196_02375 [Bifidobacterium callitrichidarum]
MGKSFVSIDFGLRNGKMVTLRELPLESYGLRCKLDCPECRKPLEAVRKDANDPSKGWDYLRHHVDDHSCPGYGENSCHLLAEHILKQAIGKTIRLPEVVTYDAWPHISRYTSKGQKRRDWQPGQASAVDSVPFLTVREPVEATIVNVTVEQRLEENNIPDLMLEVKVDGVRCQIAYEVRYEHPKTVADIRKYQASGLPVLECLVRDIDVHDPQAEDQLRERLLGLDGKYLEWLYHPETRRMADKRYRLAWGYEWYDKVSARKLATTRPMTQWKDCWREGTPDHPLATVTMDKWAMRIPVGIDLKPVETGGSIYTLAGLRAALDKAEYSGRTPFTDEDWKEAVELDRKRGEIDLSDLEVMEADCYKCGEPFTFWLCGDSVKRPKPWRLEERPQVMWTVIQYVRQHANMPLLALFTTVRPKDPSRSTFRAFECPHCHCFQGDSKLFEQYTEIRDRKYAEQQRLLNEQRKAETERRLQEYMAIAYRRQLHERAQSLTNRADDELDWIGQQLQGKLTPDATAHWQTVQACYMMLKKELETVIDSVGTDVPKGNDEKPREKNPTPVKDVSDGVDPWNMPATNTRQTEENNLHDRADYDPWTVDDNGRKVSSRQSPDDPWNIPPAKQYSPSSLYEQSSPYGVADPWVRSFGSTREPW